MVESDSEYFVRRAVQETAAADKALNPQARNAHLEMAQRYRDLVVSIEKNERGLGLRRALRRLIHR